MIDDFVLPMSDTKRSYSIQTQVNVTMSMRLSDDVTDGSPSNLSRCTDCRNAILHRNIHLIGRHAKVVIVLEIIHRSAMKLEE